MNLYVLWLMIRKLVVIVHHPIPVKKQTCILTRTVNLESPIQLKSMFFGLWEEPGVPTENPCTHRENMQTPHWKAIPDIGTRNLLAVSRHCSPSDHRAALGKLCKDVFHSLFVGTIYFLYFVFIIIVTTLDITAL